MSIQDAFEKICADAKPANGAYVSLIRQSPFYGGPEEGGWYGTDTDVISCKWCSTEDEANAVRDAVVKLADELSAEARKTFGEHCLREMEWCEERNLDADYLPEPDGEESYCVIITEEFTQSTRGCRHYE